MNEYQAYIYVTAVDGSELEIPVGETFSSFKETYENVNKIAENVYKGMWHKITVTLVGYPHELG
jgi:CO dehydrogenase/acetyl-CoA synthase beta subunit